MPTSIIDFCAWVKCSFIIDGDEAETVHHEPTLEMYQTPETMLSAIWSEHGSCQVVTDKNGYYFLPF